MEIKININVCRVCLKPPVQPVSLFTEQDQATTSGQHAGGASVGALARQFTAVTQLELNQHDGLPTTLCAKCVTRLRIGYSFRTQTHESDAYLKSFICKVKNEFQTGTTVRAAQQMDQSSSAMESELLRENGFNAAQPTSSPNTTNSPSHPSTSSSSPSSPHTSTSSLSAVVANCDQLHKSMHEDLMEDVSETIEQLEKSANLSDSSLVCGSGGMMGNLTSGHSHHHHHHLHSTSGSRRSANHNNSNNGGNSIRSVTDSLHSGISSVGGGSATGSSIMGDITDTFDEDIDDELEEQSAEDEDTTDMLVEEIIFSENAKLELENFQSFSDLTETLKKAEKQHQEQQQQQIQQQQQQQQNHQLHQQLELHDLDNESTIKVIYINQQDEEEEEEEQDEEEDEENHHFSHHHQHLTNHGLMSGKSKKKTGGRRASHFNGSLVPTMQHNSHSLNGMSPSSDSGNSSPGMTPMSTRSGSVSSSSSGSSSGSNAGVAASSTSSTSSSTTTFQCSKCDKQFPTATSLMRHQRLHEGKKMFQCQSCDKSFTQKGSLKQHLYIHTGERPFKCDICSKTFTQSKSLKFHMRCHTGEKPYECEYCQLRFSQRDSLKRHVNTFHKLVVSEYKCEYCEKVLHTKHSYAVHVKKHTNGSQFQCDICQKVLSTKTILENHRRNHLNETPFKCADCGHGFSTKSAMQQHQKVHHSQQQQQLSIPQQNQFQMQTQQQMSPLNQNGGGGSLTTIDVKPTYLTRPSPDHHRVPTHNTIISAPDQKPPIQLTATPANSNLGQNHHRMGQNQQQQQQFQCFRCLTAFDSQKTLQIHLRTEHRGDVSPQAAAFAPMSLASLPMQPMMMRSSPPHGVCSSPPAQQMAQHPGMLGMHGMQQQQHSSCSSGNCNNSSCSQMTTGCGNCKLTTTTAFQDAMEETQCAYCDSKFTSQKLFQEHQALEHKIPPMADTDKLIHHHGYGDL